LSAPGLLLITQLFQMPEILQLSYCLSVAFWLVCAPLWLKTGWHPGNPVLLAATGWIVLVPTWLALVNLQITPWVLLAVLGVVWVADSAAYFAGHRWGQRKLAPVISPGKTWEGVVGAAVAVAVYHGLVWNFGFRNYAPESGMAIAAMVAVLFPLSILGDLFESLCKRHAGVKDSGTLMPGHGGVLDRIDALTSTLPLAALALSWILPRA
jgi:phosphatidate cytidylyltransferase